MKKSIIKRLIIIMFIPMVFSVFLNYFIQFKISKKTILENSQRLFAQVGQLLKENTAEAEQLQKDFNEKCIVRARAAAYMLEYNPDAINNLSEMKKIASLLEIDEFHVFDKEGNLFAGSEPKYYGYNFNSGEQMQFFLPMLTDKSLELCQGIEPNTAESKPMQYAAVWSGNGNEIIQIGMEPERILEALKKVQISYIFSVLTIDSGAQVYAINPDTYEILCSTTEEFDGKNAAEIGFDTNKFGKKQAVHTMTIDDTRSFVTFATENDVLLARVVSCDETYDMLNRDNVYLIIYLLFIVTLMIAAVLRYLNEKIIKNIYDINDKLALITSGDLNVRMEKSDTSEFNELGTHINDMIASLINTTNKISLVLDMTKLPIGVYEYKPGMKSVMATRGVSEILHLSRSEAEKIFSDDKLFAKKIEEIRRHPFENEENVFALSEDEESFVRIDCFEYEKSTLGIVMDVSQDIAERRRIENERDEDLLTGLLNRRAFINRLQLLLEEEADAKCAALVMIDSDSLKYVNDNYGHQNGDAYLCAVSQNLSNNSSEYKLVGRFGGDEFIMFIYGCEERTELDIYLNEILSGRDTKIVKLGGEHEIALKYSVGYAIYGEDGTTRSELFRTADERMYQDKNKRKAGRL